MSHADGTITIVDLTLILNGELEYISQLLRLVISQNSVVSTGISSMAIVSPNGLSTKLSFSLFHMIVEFLYLGNHSNKVTGPETVKVFQEIQNDIKVR